MMTATGRDFTSITELPEGKATREQLSMIRSRYYEAEKRAAGKRVLEVACGPGRGLGLLARRAAFVVGGDITFELVRRARAHHGHDVRLVQMDAQRIPFANGSFDLVVLFEALYYVPNAELFMAECRRILSDGGTLIVSSVNPEWSGCSPSPMSTRYFSARELEALARRHGFETELWCGFRTSGATLVSEAVELVRRAAVGLGLMPRTLGGRALLKRLFYGRLSVLGAEVAEAGERDVPDLLRVSGPVTNYKILYCVCTRMPRLKSEAGNL